MILKKIQTAGRKLAVDLIGETLDEMLRLIVSVKYGEERASRIIS